MILIIDIDETLIHSMKSVYSSSLLNDNDINQSDLFNVFNYTVQKRPYLDMFLAKVLNDEYYEVVFWTAATHDYAYGILNQIIPDWKKVKLVLTRDHCDELDCKPLGKVRNLIHQLDIRNGVNQMYERTVHDFLIIDNKKGVTGHDHLNHLEIIDFEGDILDNELERLWEYLDKNRYHSSEYLAANWK